MLNKLSKIQSYWENFSKLGTVVRAVALTLLLAVDVSAGELVWNQTNQSFEKSKKVLAWYVYKDDRTEFYCGMKFDEKGYITDYNWFNISKYRAFMDKIQWDHIVPAENFGQSFKEWREWDFSCIDSKWKEFKWRKCAEKVNETYRKMQADLYNLVPANWSLNVMRWKSLFGMIEWEVREFWSCNFEFDGKIVEPRDEMMWVVARIYMYMDETYPWHGIISNKNIKLYQAWDRLFPVTKAEVDRAQKIEKIQWNINYVIKERAEKLGLR